MAARIAPGHLQRASSVNDQEGNGPPVGNGIARRPLVGENVRFRTRSFETGKDAKQWLIAVIVEELAPNELYILALRQGVLKEPMSRCAFQLLPKKYIELSQVPVDRTISLRLGSIMSRMSVE